MAESKRWIVTTSGGRSLKDVASDIEAAGFAIDEVLEAIGIIAGSLVTVSQKAVCVIPGVADVSPDQLGRHRAAGTPLDDLVVKEKTRPTAVPTDEQHTHTESWLRPFMRSCDSEYTGRHSSALDHAAGNGSRQVFSRPDIDFDSAGADRGLWSDQPPAAGCGSRPRKSGEADERRHAGANAEVRVVDPDILEDVPTGEQGELWFRTPQLMKGYHNKPDATAEAVTEDGWFRTGDIGRVDDGGYIFVEDRLKDMIISGGENIYSIEVERVLAEHPAVAEVAVIGVPDEKWGEVVKAVVSLEGEVTEEELIAWSRERLAAYKRPKTVDITDELPRNPTGKILKKDLRKPFWEGRDRATV